MQLGNGAYRKRLHRLGQADTLAEQINYPAGVNWIWIAVIGGGLVFLYWITRPQAWKR